jgi:hypothetical protein
MSKKKDGSHSDGDEPSAKDAPVGLTDAQLRARVTAAMHVSWDLALTPQQAVRLFHLLRMEHADLFLSALALKGLTRAVLEDMNTGWVELGEDDVKVMNVAQLKDSVLEWARANDLFVDRPGGAGTARAVSRKALDELVEEGKTVALSISGVSVEHDQRGGSRDGDGRASHAAVTEAREGEAKEARHQALDAFRISPDLVMATGRPQLGRVPMAQTRGERGGKTLAQGELAVQERGNHMDEDEWGRSRVKKLQEQRRRDAWEYEQFGGGSHAPVREQFGGRGPHNGHQEARDRFDGSGGRRFGPTTSTAPLPTTSQNGERVSFENHPPRQRTSPTIEVFEAFLADAAQYYGRPAHPSAQQDAKREFSLTDAQFDYLYKQSGRGSRDPAYEQFAEFEYHRDARFQSSSTQRPWDDGRAELELAEAQRVVDEANARLRAKQREKRVRDHVQRRDFDVFDGHGPTPRSQPYFPSTDRHAPGSGRWKKGEEGRDELTSLLEQDDEVLDPLASRFHLAGWDVEATQRLMQTQLATSLALFERDQGAKGHATRVTKALTSGNKKALAALRRPRRHGNKKDAEEYVLWDFLEAIPATYDTFYDYVAAPESGFYVGRSGLNDDVQMKRDCADMSTVLDLIATGHPAEAREVGIRFLNVRFLMGEWRQKNLGARDDKPMWKEVLKIRSNLASRGTNPTPAAYR